MRCLKFVIGAFGHALVVGCGAGITTVAIPDGDYVVGCNDGALCGESSRRMVRIGRFAIDKYEATVGDYERCVKDDGCPRLPPSRYPDPPHAVAALTVSQADHYCRWRGARLPTAIEWEIAARGHSDRTYAWRTDAAPHDHVASAKIVREHDVGVAWYFVPGTARSGDSAFGVSDMSGTLPELVRAADGTWALRGAPPGFFSTEPLDFSILRSRPAPRDAHGSARCVHI